MALTLASGFDPMEMDLAFVEVIDMVIQHYFADGFASGSLDVEFLLVGVWS